MTEVAESRQDKVGEFEKLCGMVRHRSHFGNKKKKRKKKSIPDGGRKIMSYQLLNVELWQHSHPSA